MDTGPSMRQIPIAQPFITEEEWHAVKDCLLTGWLTQGPKVAEFEREFAKRHNVKHAIAVTSCTSALHIILVALGIGPGDEVIIPAFTWIATANVVLYCGAKPVFADVDPTTYNIDPEDLKKRLTKKTKAIIPVHLFGLCADIDSIKEMAGEIMIVEDAACAAGSEYKGRSAGSLGIAGAFSFHPRKIITTGEGGMVTTTEDHLAEKIVMLRNHGASISEEERHRGPRPYILPEFNLLGFNYRMTDIQGSIGLVQLKKLDHFITERQKWAEYYLTELSDLKWLKLPVVPEGYRHSWQSFVCYVKEEKAPMKRNELMEYLHFRGISTRPGTHAVPMLGYYQRNLGVDADDFPGARDCQRYTMALPIHNQMSQDDYEYIVNTLREIK